MNFTEPQLMVIKNNLGKLRTYLSEEEVKALQDISATNSLHISVINDVVGDILALTTKNLTWTGRAERIKNIQKFIQNYEKHPNQAA